MKEIPKLHVPSIQDYSIKNMEEDIVSLSDYGFICESQYYLQGIPGAYKTCYARKSVAEKLMKAEQMLPPGYRFKIYDGYRPICIQERLWKHYRQDLKNKYPYLSDEELDYKTSFFVSKPSHDILHPSLHNTGGAIDLTIIDADGKELNMGTHFDDFSDKAWTNHFEEYENNEVVRNNRRLLYWTMINTGFTNLPSEWWHYDYGTKFWGYFTNQDALYAGILDIDYPDRFPLI